VRAERAVEGVRHFAHFGLFGLQWFQLTHEDRNAVARAAKAQLRRIAKLRIASLTPEERARADEAVSSHLVEIARELHATFVVAYVALSDEVSVEPFLKHLDGRGVPTLVPRVVVPGRVELAVWSPGCSLVRDVEGVPAPQELSGWPDGSGLLVVPGRIFDTEGGRIGRGRGYYDRFLAEARAGVVVAGAAYEVQVVDRIPREPHDAGVDWLVTETGRRNFANR
jgi:5-formyltetrahydrofolate cyclo-ligase